MPQKGAEDIPHVSVHDHKIQIPGQQDTAQKIRKLMGLYAVNNPNPSPINQLNAYLNYYEKFDPNPLYLQKAKDFIDEGVGGVVSKVHYYYLTLNYTQLLQLVHQYSAEEIEDAWTLYRLGKAAWNRQEWSTAQPYLRKACLLLPDNLRFIEQYGQLLVEANQTQDACEWWLQHQNTSTQSDIIFANNAACFLESGNRNEAKMWAEKALKLNPDNILANNVLYLLYQSIGQEEKAKVYKSKLNQHE